MTHNLQHSIALLARTPAALDALLRGLPPEWTRSTEGDGTWSAYDVVGHLIYCEHADWLPRARVILDSGEEQPFPPFDRSGHLRLVEGKSLEHLLDEFSRLRAANLDELRSWNLTAEQLVRRGRHPLLGSVTLSNLLATWAAHDLTHLHQISRVMAFQYRDAVGPWTKFLGVLQCTAHSAPG